MKHLIIIGLLALVLAACATPVAQPEDLSVTYTTYGAFTMPQHAITTVTIDGRDVTIDHAYANGTVTSSIGYTASRDSIAALQSAIRASDFPALPATIEAPEPIPVADVGSANLTIERGDDRAHTVIELNYQPEMPTDIARIVDAIYEVTMEAPQPEYEGQRAFEPMQCEQTPWDEWYSEGNIQYLVEPTQEQLITDYYSQVHDIEIRNVEERTRDGAVCEACNVCPQSTYYVAWIAGDDVEAIEDLGWGAVPDEARSVDEDMLEGEWRLISGEDTEGGFEADATIVFSDGRVSGSAPCNSYSGDVSIGDGSIDLETLAQTERACLDQEQMESEARYFDTLRNIDAFELQDGVLALTGEDAELRYVRESTPDEPVAEQMLEDGWRLIGGSIDGETVDFDASLEIENDRIGGSAPCNGYGADATFDTGDVTLGPVVSTMMYCEGQMDDESSYLRALEAVDSYVIDADTLTLSGENVKLVYERDDARTSVYFTDAPCEQNPDWYPEIGSSDVSSVEAYLADLGIDAEVTYTSRGAVCKACLPSCAGSYVSANVEASEADTLIAQGWIQEHPFPDEPVTNE